MSIEVGGEFYDYDSDRFRPEISPVQGMYVPVPEMIETAVKRDVLNARIQLVVQASLKDTYTIDRSIQVSVPSASFRGDAASHWESRQSSHRAWGWTAVVLTAPALAALLTPVPYIALAAVVTVVYAAVQFHRAGQASDQVAKWREDPAAKLALERTKAYEQGFSYVYHKNLKLGESSRHAVLLPHEVEYLYHRYSERTCTDLSARRCASDSQKKEWLDSFRTDNPISQEVLRYVFGNVPEELSQLSRNFEGIAASLRHIAADFSELKEQRSSEAKQMIRGIESQRTAALMIPGTALDYKLNEAFQRREQRLREGESSVQVDRDYENEKNNYNAVYNIAVLPINSYFDGKVSEVQGALKETLRVITRQEAHAFSPYYEYSQGLIAATLAAKDPGYVYHQPAFNPIEGFHIPALPKVEIHFTYERPAAVDSSFWQH